MNRLGGGFVWEWCDQGILCLNYKQSGIGSTRCGPALAEKYQFCEKEFQVQFLLSKKKLERGRYERSEERL